MKTKTSIILIVLVGLGVGGFLVYQNISVPEIEKGVVPAPATQVQVYKGIWIPTLLSENTHKLDSDMKKLKEMGMNTVFFQGAPPHVERCLEGVDPNSNLAKKIKKIIPIQKELLISNIQTAHKNGLKVALTMSKCMAVAEEISIEDWNSKVIEYAKLAEEHQVEFFAPMNEPEVLFGPSASATWGQDILPKIKEVYHGEVIWKGDAIGGMEPGPGQPQPNFSGYDYLGVTISVGSGVTLEEHSQRVDPNLDRALDLAERSNVKVMITEFYGKLPYQWEREAWNEEKEARAHEIILEKGSKRDKVVGFFVLDFLEISNLPREATGLPDPEKSLKTKGVIKKWFTEILK